MKYRAILKQSDGWWIGWLIDLPGVNAQEKTQEACMESLRTGVKEMLSTPVNFEPNSIMTVLEVADAA